MGLPQCPIYQAIPVKGQEISHCGEEAVPSPQPPVDPPHLGFDSSLNERVFGHDFAGLRKIGE